jgi:hypothetical protein
MKTARFLAALLCLFSMGFLHGCSSIKEALDVNGIGESATSTLASAKRFLGDRLSGPIELAKTVDSFDPFSKLEAAAAVRPGIETLDRWKLSSEGSDFHQEKIVFPSVSPARAGAPDNAVFYLYFKGELRGKRTILWVPGYGVSDFAFTFIHTFFTIELDHGYAILFYTIPGQLERVHEGEKSGDGLLSADPAVNLATVATVLGELETGMSFLRARGVESFSAWGGSMGAAFLLLLAERERFDHLVLMIPVLDGNSIMDNPEMDRVRSRLRAEGYPDQLVERAYRAISPQYQTWNIDSHRVFIQYARYDRLTPEPLTLQFASERGIAVKGYNESHGTILLNGEMLADYRRFLDAIGNP